jgi:hypothetical protein
MKTMYKLRNQLIRKSAHLLILMLISSSIFAQSPEKMSYQAVIRNSSDQLVTNQTIGMQISILQGSASGLAVYVETHTPTTNINGLVSVEIGTGTTSDDFSTIDWANGPYFIKTETDTAGGTNYTITGTSQLLSVPYSLYAKEAEAITGGFPAETDPVFAASVASGITGLDTTNWNIDNDSTNELQTLSISADTISISSGNSIVLPSSADNDWLVAGNNMTALPIGNIAIGVMVLPNAKFTVGDTGIFRVVVGHAGNFNEAESGRLVFTEDVNFSGTCGFEFLHDGAANTLSLLSGCPTLGDTSIVFTRTGEVRIPERLKIGENSNPVCDIHVKQYGTGTSPGSSGLRLENSDTPVYNQIWTDGTNLNFSLNTTRIAYITNVGAYTQVSDKRMKNNITPMNSVLSDVMKLKPVEYFYNHSESTVKSIGFIAQDVQQIFPGLVNISEDTGMLAIQYIEFGVIAVKAIQEQQVQIEQQAAIINAQQAEIDALKADVEMLKGIIRYEEPTTSVNTKQDAPPVITNSAYKTDADQK